MAGIRLWLARIIQVLTGKSPGQAEDNQETPVDLAPTKRYEVLAVRKKGDTSRACLRLDSQVIPLQSGFLVGRGASCHLRLSDPKVSRVHASFQPMGASWLVQDNASRNGTFLNGRRIKRALLHHGDTIRLGQTVLTFEER